MPNFVKRNDNGPMPDCPNDDSPTDRAMQRDLERGLSSDEILRRQAAISHEMRDDLELVNAERTKRRGLNVNTTRAPWLVK